MTGENVTSVMDADQDDGDGRQRSTIQFPYNNLNDAKEVAEAIHSNVGTGECDDAQLAAWMNLSPKSSGYRIQVSASRMFGLVETTSGKHHLTLLGRMIVDPQREREARARAFLQVPLYRAIFDKYNGGVIPPPAALERDIIGLGVAEKQTGRARSVFERSAEQAGYFEHGKNRLIMPGIASRAAEEERPREKEEEKGGGSGTGNGGNGGAPPGVDPIIAGLLARLPKSGDVWPEAERKLWLGLLEGSFKLIFKDA
ncbi:MAG TPA: hypothetical protein VMU22_09075 [Rhizomicrobium sp.]|nr:hypothetical protein [Rhizomicrobium sp.]